MFGSIPFNPGAQTPQKPRPDGGQPPQPPPPPPSASKTPRASARTAEQKVDNVLQAITDNNLNLATFLYLLFRLEKRDPRSKGGLDGINPFDKLPAQSDPNRATRSEKHQRMLTAFFNGTSKPHLGVILAEIWRNARETGDSPATTHPFEDKKPFTEIPLAIKAFATFASRAVIDMVGEEAERMVERRSGLHIRAQLKEGGRGSREDERASWAKIEDFSFEKGAQIAKENAPVLWNCMLKFTGYNEEEDQGPVIKYRPKRLVCTNAIMSLAFAKSNRANLIPLCRGIWMFSALAPKTMFRVESRLGMSVSYSSTHRALKNMSKEQGKEKKRDHGLGRVSEMVKGMAATAIQMDNIDPEAFNLTNLLERQAKNERRTLTADMILDDIDWTHLERVAAYQFLSVLIHHVPSLSNSDHRKHLKQFSDSGLKKFERPKNFQSKVYPLATNSADEMKVQELREAIIDFASTQLGITEETIDNRCWPFSGDGKTFDAFLRLRKQSSVEELTFESFGWMIPLLEVWHAKWTDLSRVVRGHHGDSTDPSSLAFFAQLTGCPQPADLRKVDFYDGQHLVNLSFEALVLNVWEQEFRTTDLVQHFEHMSTLPPFGDLVSRARRLSHSHASSQAYQFVSTPSQSMRNPGIPVGTEWTTSEEIQSTTPANPAPNPTPDTGPATSDLQDEGIAIPDPDPLPVPQPPDTRESDKAAANITLFLRDALWWREVCLAVSEGDTGRLLEMFKVWIFTFAGSKNPFYSTFLLEIYCNFKWEFSPELRHALMFYWLVNLSGLPGCYIELDLLQEHFNFWLEEMVQHKGKSFDDPFYREVVARNIHHFLKLKDEMEQRVQLQARTKRHTNPKLDNERNLLLSHIRQFQLNKYRAGRTYGFSVQDDFSVGHDKIVDGKLKKFIARSSEYATRLQARGYGAIEEGSEAERLELDEDLELEGRGLARRAGGHTSDITSSADGLC
ncbi:hypothetical protein CC1G_06652 [Coprinopsis cinerea okayama7|uniref:DUF6589 domain-containing protein n=1 Tax=Coprinopsis cinerea (strain Okayama-7 / 130 / ATCC MYA-4618 / FGSC 9003) TaxID=240176 RepID=A8P7V9_COPC7|nr:hypothetical protein CC1G_06652 [Coprinopsis cinerea okayama7\|eukprot:XP_001839439.2 hypothetical protein CC1G_06652 [Coprinopsis cinerea okayama7\